MINLKPVSLCNLWKECHELLSISHVQLAFARYQLCARVFYRFFINKLMTLKDPLIWSFSPIWGLGAWGKTSVYHKPRERCMQKPNVPKAAAVGPLSWCCKIIISHISYHTQLYYPGGRVGCLPACHLQITRVGPSRLMHFKVVCFIDFCFLPPGRQVVSCHFSLLSVCFL